ncbi:hypothetical protein FGO68_gene3705 [Halteria grandinella]|uniref:Uncharacterized protein n=1 Tax=Halteria grandinella TaxID=5974 RepID=A0A8J8NMU6_HALGN|nr:hypothetical protein FGO68_gene3705 [Halteria grandinella]
MSSFQETTKPEEDDQQITIDPGVASKGLQQPDRGKTWTIIALAIAAAFVIMLLALSFYCCYLRNRIPRQIAHTYEQEERIQKQRQSLKSQSPPIIKPKQDVIISNVDIEVDALDKSAINKLNTFHRISLKSKLKSDIKERMKGRFSDGIHFEDLHVVDLLNTSNPIYEEDSDGNVVVIVPEGEMETAGTSPQKSPRKLFNHEKAPIFFIKSTIDFDAKFNRLRHENDHLFPRDSLATSLAYYQSGKSTRRMKSKSAVINGIAMGGGSSSRSRSSGGRMKQRESVKEDNNYSHKNLTSKYTSQRESFIEIEKKDETNRRLSRNGENILLQVIQPVSNFRRNQQFTAEFA